MRPYGHQRPPMPPMRPYGYRAAPITAPPATTTESTIESVAASQAITIGIQGMAFQPASLTIKAGSKVTWTNNDGTPHTVFSMDSGPLASGTLNFGERYSMILGEPGTYPYYCKIHPGIRAAIIVE